MSTTASHWKNGRKIRHITEQVEDLLEIGKGTLKRGSRMRAFVTGRALACYLARRTTSASYPEIAKWLGYRDHTSVMDMEARGEEMYRNGDLELQQRMMRIGRCVTGDANWR